MKRFVVVMMMNRAEFLLGLARYVFLSFPAQILGISPLLAFTRMPQSCHCRYPAHVGSRRWYHINIVPQETFQT